MNMYVWNAVIRKDFGRTETMNDGIGGITIDNHLREWLGLAHKPGVMLN